MKIITWNTQWCRGLDGQVSVERIVSQARDMANFDVLCLQEIASGFEAMPGQPGDQPAQLQALLPDHQVFFGAAVDEFDSAGKHQRFGNLIATRLPVVRVEHHPLPWPADPSVPSMPRMCSVVTMQAPGLGAIRVMTTHLAYDSGLQRMAQVQSLRDLHQEACALAMTPPAAGEGDSPFRNREHTPHAILCGDFNFDPSTQEYTKLQEPFQSNVYSHAPLMASNAKDYCLHDAWPLVHGQTPHEPTFRVYDQTYGPEPITCDFMFVSQSLVKHVVRLSAKTDTKASDHQPLLLELN